MSFCRLLFTCVFVFQIGGNDLTAVLKLNQKVDYESQKNYHLVVRAYDGRNRTGDLRVNVAVIDVNDIAPEFENSEYTRSVFENASIGQCYMSQ